MAVYIGGSVNSGPSDQTDLNKQRRYNLGCGGELTFEGEDDMWGPQVGRPVGGASQPLKVCFCGLPYGVF